MYRLIFLTIMGVPCVPSVPWNTLTRNYIKPKTPRSNEQGVDIFNVETQYLASLTGKINYSPFSAFSSLAAGASGVSSAAGVSSTAGATSAFGSSTTTASSTAASAFGAAALAAPPLPEPRRRVDFLAAAAPSLV